MTTAEIKKLKKGDYILFRTFHFRSGFFKGKRKIVDIDNTGVQVRCFGWSNFYLKNSEIISKV